MFLLSLVLGIVLKGADDAVKDIYSKYLLYFNEALIALSLALGLCTLIGTERNAPKGERISAGRFIKLICICFTVGWVGNLIGTVLLLVWNTVTGNQVVNQLTGVILNTEPLQMLICTGILAPILEEFFFRKVLIDRTHKYGELTAILVSAAFFGLFHQNFSQFFYAFGLGIIFGYVYCRTGSYLTVTLMHMVFNTLMGVIPGLLLPRVLEFLNKINEINMEQFDELLPLVAEYALPLAVYMLYSLVLMAVYIAGGIILLLNFKKSKLENNAPELTAPEKRRAALLNAGTISAAALLIALTVATLFM
jgi:membrane protease YdiL (CAAX protease family)